MPTRDQPKRSALWWLGVTTPLAYAAGILTFFAVRAFTARWPQLFALLSYAGPFLYAPLILVLPLAFLSHSRVAQVGVLATLVLFLVIYLPFFLPRLSGLPPSSGPEVTVLAFNLGPGQGRPEEVVDAIAGAGADIVAVEELTPEVGQRLREKLGALYRFTVLEPAESDTGLLSRYPIVSQERFRPAGFGRQALEAAVDVRGVLTQVIVVHPQPPGLIWSRRARSVPVGVRDAQLAEQIADVARRAGALPEPVLVLGDFNMSDQGQAYASMAARFGDAFREAGFGFGFTFPDGLQLGRYRTRPVLRIDYVFHSPGVYAREATVGCGKGSDHCYVTATLVLGS
jgi:vancomycin resistance protein VanJ